MKPMLYWSLLLILLSCCLEIRKASEIQFQALDMSLQYLSSASVCNRTSTSGIKNMDSRLEVVDKYGPCAQTDQNPPVSSPSFAKILANDQLRVKYIQNRAKPDSINKSQNPNKFSWDEKAQIPAQSGLPLGSSNYIITVGLGTPERRLSIVFDTGSELMWTQCKPCIRCHRQKDTIFDPRLSKSYSNISCSDKKCSQLDKPGCSSETCVYTIGYGDGSMTIGFFAKDKLTVTQTDVFKDFLFGCGHNNTDGYGFGRTDGLLGFDRGPLSFVSQTAEIYLKYFSYCLPPTTNSPGFLAFGKNNKAAKKDVDATMIFTPFVRPSPGFSPTSYFIKITAISVGKNRLSINRSTIEMKNTVIDSGTVITRLPRAIYNKMSIEFKRQMNKLNYKSAPAYDDGFFDTCFHIPPHTKAINVPIVSFTFKGNATINLDASGTLYTINPTYVCFAFHGHVDSYHLAIFGNTQQKKFEVAYDVAGNKLGFAPNPNCQCS